MSDQFLAEIRAFPYNFAPYGWALCNGQIMAISQNTALFSLIGTFYGGNGTSNFALPNLQASLTIHQGQGPALSQYVVGETGGSDTVTVLQAQMPAHNHQFMAFQQGRARTPHADPLAGDAVAGAGTNLAYAAGPANTQMSPLSLAPYGNSQAHNNRMPSLGLTFCIALQGIYPARS